MKKMVLAALASLLSLSVYGEGIYVGDVRFFAKEVCSREFTSTFEYNSGCLPLTRASNVQNYFFESIRLPISHDEAKKLDQAAQGYLVDKPTELVQASAAAEGLSELIKQVNKEVAALAKLEFKQDAAIDAAITSLDSLSDPDARKKITALFTPASGVAASAVAAASAVGPSVTAVKLDVIQKVADGVAPLESALQGKLKELNAASTGPDVLKSGEISLAAVKEELTKLVGGKAIGDAIAALKPLNLDKVAAILKAFDEQANVLDAKISAINNAVGKLTDKDASTAKKLTDATASLQKTLDGLQNNLARIRLLQVSIKHTSDALEQYNPAIKKQAASVSSELSAIVAGTDAEVFRGELRTALESASSLTIAESTPFIHPNLLPSLIGRVFVTDKKGDTKDIRYKVPEHGGNFQFIPLDDKGKIRQISTEVLINSDLNGVIQKNLAASATIDLDQVINAALKAANITAPKSNTQLKMELKAALSRTSSGSGNYYYVSMTDEELDKLTGKTLKAYLSTQPIDRDETHRSNEASMSGDIAPAAPDFVKALDELGIANLGIGENQGLGVITGVAVLRTRSGQTEVCSSKEVSVYNPTKKPQPLGNDATTCNELRNILASNGIDHADIPAALASLNAGYRQESYKTLRIGDHASVLAIQWVPIHPGVTAKDEIKPDSAKPDSAKPDTAKPAAVTIDKPKPAKHEK